MLPEQEINIVKVKSKKRWVFSGLFIAALGLAVSWIPAVGLALSFIGLLFAGTSFYHSIKHKSRYVISIAALVISLTGTSISAYLTFNFVQLLNKGSQLYDNGQKSFELKMNDAILQADTATRKK